MNKKGFTLIELLIVVAIIGIVAAIAIPNLLVALQKGKQKSTMGDMKSTGTAIESYITDWSQAPNVTSVTGLDSSWFRPFYVKIVPKRDAWGSTFGYSHAGDLYTIRSYGRDKAAGTVGLGDYNVTQLADFNQDICYSNGQFTYGPRVKK